MHHICGFILLYAFYLYNFVGRDYSNISFRSQDKTGAQRHWCHQPPQPGSRLQSAFQPENYF